MKRVFILLTVCFVLLAGCSADLPQKSNEEIQTEDINETPFLPHLDNEEIEVPIGDLIEIKEKLFIAQTNDIYYNFEDYIGKTIKYEGIFDIYQIPETDKKHYFVIRYGPGCCGIDANAGFEVIWDKDYPYQNDWVEVIGVLEEYEEEGYKYLRVALTSLKVLPTRGAEYVFQ